MKSRSPWYATGESPGADAFTYDGSGRPLTTTHADGSVQRITYAVGSATTIDEMDHRRTVYTDGFGRTRQVRERNGDANHDTVIRRDALGRVVRIEDAGDNPTTFTWDSLGR